MSWTPPPYRLSRFSLLFVESNITGLCFQPEGRLHFTLFFVVVGFLLWFWFICLFIGLLASSNSALTSRTIKESFPFPVAGKTSLNLKNVCVGFSFTASCFLSLKEHCSRFCYKNTAICLVKPQKEKSIAHDIRTPFFFFLSPAMRLFSTPYSAYLNNWQSQYVLRSHLPLPPHYIVSPLPH